MYSAEREWGRNWINGWGKAVLACFCLDVSGAADCIVLLQIHNPASFTIVGAALKDNLLSHPLLINVDSVRPAVVLIIR